MIRLFQVSILILISGCSGEAANSSLPKCQNNQVQFVYTPCDKDDNVWRVQVPSATCQISTPESPVKGVKCSTECKPGEFLDIVSQECKQCKEGKFSVGDGKRFADWDKMPTGFKSRGFSELNSYEKTHKKEKDDPCYSAGWTPRGEYLESNGSSCRSVLKFETELKKEGNITFSVKSSSDRTLFHVWSEGQDCSTSYEARGDRIEDSKYENYYTPSNEWKKHTLGMRKGHNTVFFVASHLSNIFDTASKMDAFESESENTVIVKEIVVRGYAYSLQCDKCEAGTQSSKGASSCEPCPKNTFSSAGSGTCKECSKSEYSPPRSEKCFPRLQCKENDYHHYWETCENGKTRKKYHWTDPKICDDTLPNSVKLPEQGPLVECPGCNPGFENNGTDCLLCKNNYFNENGRGACKKCPPNTKSSPKFHFKYWKNLPGKMMHLYCLARPDDGCKTKSGWTLHDSYISTGLGHADDAELLMYIIVPGFTSHKSKFRMTYKIICPSNNCRLRVQSVEAANLIEDIRQIDGNAERDTIEYTRTSSAKTRYRITFEKKYNKNMQSFKYTTSTLQIFEIEVTNVVDGGAEKCESCKDNQANCIKCELGTYIDGSKCVKCPKDTFSSGTDSIVGIESCKKCPPNTMSDPGSSECHSDCKVVISNDKTVQTFNLTALAGMHTVNANERFTTKGYSYHHSYAVSICGHPYQPSLCVNNATTDNKNAKISAAVCRNTMIPEKNSLLAAQPISIGEVISSVEVINNTMVSGNMTDGETSKVLLNSNGNIVFTFFSRRYTEVCQNGTSAMVTLVCDHTKQGQLQLGDKECSMETCNGCLYHFTWRTVHACAQCSKSNYKTIQGGCKDGKKTLHYVWEENRKCIGGVEKPADETEECSIFEKSILDFKVVILGFLVFGLLLAIIIIVLCYRNRRLSYKYSRLIDSGQSRDGELPAADVCAFEEGEEEEDEVILSRSKGKTPKILDRLKGMRKKKEDFSEFETINLDSIKLNSDTDDQDEEL